MIGYVLLVGIALVMSMVVYQLIKTYVPKDAIECPDGVSVFMQEATYNSDTDNLNITIKNNGLFSVAGYFIHATIDEDQELATEDLSESLSEDSSWIKYSHSIIFLAGENALAPNEVMKTVFTDVGTIYKVEIIPVRFQDIEGKTRFASCGGARIEEVLSSWETCVPGTCVSLGYECGTWSDGCIGNIDCPDCSVEGEECDGEGQCVEECLDTCTDTGYECGTICGENCGICLTTEECITGTCVLLCGNGELDSGEDCDGGSNCQEDCTCSAGYESDGVGGCSLIITVDSCKSLCASLGYDDSLSSCALNCGGSCSGTCESTGDQYCSSPQSYCCCVPYA